MNCLSITGRLAIALSVMAAAVAGVAQPTMGNRLPRSVMEAYDRETNKRLESVRAAQQLIIDGKPQLAERIVTIALADLRAAHDGTALAESVLAESLLAQDSYREALNVMLRLRENNRSSRIAADLALCYLGLGDVDAAEDCLEGWLKEYPPYWRGQTSPEPVAITRANRINDIRGTALMLRATGCRNATELKGAGKDFVGAYSLTKNKTVALLAARWFFDAHQIGKASEYAGYAASGRGNVGRGGRALLVKVDKETEAGKTSGNGSG